MAGDMASRAVGPHWGGRRTARPCLRSTDVRQVATTPAKAPTLTLPRRTGRGDRSRRCGLPCQRTHQNMHLSLNSAVVGTMGLLMLAPSCVRADEGMWLFNRPPLAVLKDRY